MKKQLKFWGVAILICITLIAMASMVQINMVQRQLQNQNQITKQYNTQLTIVDTHKQVDRIEWRTRNVLNSGELAEFYNTRLDLYQQRESKVYQNDSGITILYPVINGTEVKTYTNKQSQSQMQTNEIQFNIFQKVKGLLK